MKRPSIKVSLIATTVGLVALSALMSWSSIRAMEHMGINNDAIVDKWMPSVSRSKEIAVTMAKLRIAYRNHILAGDAAAKDAAEKQIAEAQQATQAAIGAYAELAQQPEQQQELAALNDNLHAYEKAGEALVSDSRNGKDKDAKQILADSAKYAKAVDAVVGKIVADNESGSRRDGQDNQETIASSIELAYVMSGIVLLLGIAAVFFSVKTIAQPIGRITGSMKKLAEGDTAAAIPFASRSDEIGAMAAAVEVFRQAALANQRLQIEAEESRQQAEADRIAAQEKAEADAAERLKVATSGLASGLKRLADGDLSFQLNDAFAPDFEALRHDFNQSVKQLGTALTQISHSIAAMDSGTREIASGANDLSKRTEQQAASLEETAAALDEITANVGNSSKRTDDARTVAGQANQSAVKSADVVSHAEEAMRRIETSSEQISNIIGVIDEIAFQTNLLALNAGVEAARAGEAGKGFAVVAQEVRELAQRSAKAAKEIKQLIQNSTAEVSSGVGLVRDTGQALKTIGGFIVEINAHMEAIAVSAKEQATGLAEVNIAVNSMDQSTQQNAAMVEQSNAASNTLAQEAQKLRDLVAQFKLDGMASVQSAALRQTARAMAEPQKRSVPQAAPARKAASGGSAAGSWEEF